MFAKTNLLGVVKVVVQRKFKAHSLHHEGHKALQQLRDHAVKQPGFLWSEIMANVENYHDQLLVTQWEDLVAWVEFSCDGERRRLLKLIEPHLTEPERVSVYVGTSVNTNEKFLNDRVSELRGGSLGDAVTAHRLRD